MRLFYFVLLGFTLFSCTDLEKGNHIQALEKMDKSLDSIQTVLLENEIDTIAALGIAANTVELRIKNNYYSDTIDMELGKKIDAYKLMRKTLGPLGRSFWVIKSGVVEEKLVLDKLQADIEKGDGDRKKYEEYVQFEQAKVDQLRSLLRDYVEQKNKTMKTFHELHPELDAFSRSLLNNKKKV